MQASSFADVLDLALGRTPAAPSTAPARAARSQPFGVAPFLFGRPLTSAKPRWPEQPDARPRRPRHELNQAQQAAFNRFADLGASLGADFSADELRRAYRHLAQRYHPDRHVAVSAGQRAILACGFADAAASYRSLRALVDPRH